MLGEQYSPFPTGILFQRVISSCPKLISRFTPSWLCQKIQPLFTSLRFKGDSHFYSTVKHPKMVKYHLLQILPNAALLSSVRVLVTPLAGVTSHPVTFITCLRPYKDYIFRKLMTATINWRPSDQARIKIQRGSRCKEDQDATGIKMQQGTICNEDRDATRVNM